MSKQAHRFKKKREIAYVPGHAMPKSSREEGVFMNTFFTAYTRAYTNFGYLVYLIKLYLIFSFFVSQVLGPISWGFFRSL